MAGIYLHIPFCVRKCAYCDFVSFPNGSVPESYADALLTEIELVSRGGSYPAAFDTVFFGGGTPSLLTGDQMRRIMSVLRERFDIRADAEISMEANPGTVTPEKDGCLSRSGHQPSLDRAAEHARHAASRDWAHPFV
jgi:oxygen-independent coproporphyrinogen-3 oxidase